MATSDVQSPLAAPPHGRQVERSLLSTQIADSLRKEILLGQLKAGTRLSQQQLCEQFGTSRMPVRDALRALTHEGLLLTDVGNHTVVAPFSRQDLLDSYLIEGTILGLAAERASRNATKDDLDGLEAIHARMTSASRAKDYPAATEANWQFHRTINRLAGSRKLLAAIKSASVDLPRGLLIEQSDWNAQTNRDHAEILGSMRKRAHKRVRELMTEHVVQSGERLLDYLVSQGLQLD